MGLRRTDYVPKLFADGLVHREVQIRKQELQDFNKTLEDCGGDLSEYNRYLEMVEDLAYNLTHQVDVAATREQIAAYREANQAQIKATRERLELEHRVVRQQLAQEQREQQARRRAHLQERLDEQSKAERSKQAVLAQLAASKRPAADIMSEYQLTAKLEKDAAQAARAAEMTRCRLRKRSRAPAEATSPGVPVGPRYMYRPRIRQHFGPPFPATPQLAQLAMAAAPLRADRQQQLQAAGCTARLTAQRSIQEAFSCLFVT